MEGQRLNHWPSIFATADALGALAMGRRLVLLGHKIGSYPGPEDAGLKTGMAATSGYSTSYRGTFCDAVADDEKPRGQTDLSTSFSSACSLIYARVALMFRSFASVNFVPFYLHVVNPGLRGSLQGYDSQT